MSRLPLRLAGGGFGQVLIARGLHGRPLDQPHVTAYYGSSGSIIGRELTDDRGNSVDVIDLLRRDAARTVLDGWFPGGIRHEFGLQFADFLAAIESGDGIAPECDGRQGLRDLALAYAQLESSLLGREVSPEEVIDRRAYAWQEPIDASLGLGG